MNETSAKAPSVASKVATIFKLLAILDNQTSRNNEKAFQLKSRFLGTPADEIEEGAKDSAEPVGILNRIISQLDFLIKKTAETQKFLAEVLEQTEE